MTPEIDPATLTDQDAPLAESPQAASAELGKAQAEIAGLKDAFLRAKAETDNVRKIAQADVAKAHKFAIESFAEDLLPVKDALEKALGTQGQTVETIVHGAELTLKALQSAFSRAQVKEVEPAVGDKFDPHRHEAIAMAPSAQPANTVVNVYEKGYLLNDRMLRPAKVVVSSGPPGNG
ncbi:MAG TPA: nucleotide exchange factor GrpE [Casimicrobiaceae bacterium]|nr:nucleotide exchange factor GrpE [Casimicrobiaceae bacterium]